MNKDRVDWDKQPLGEMTDEALGKRVGRSKDTVQQQRNKRNIRSYQDKYGRYGINWDDQPYAELFDGELAVLLNTTRSAVYWQRRKRNIKAKYHQERCQVVLDRSGVELLYALLRAVLMGHDLSVLARNRNFKRLVQAVARSRYLLDKRSERDNKSKEASGGNVHQDQTRPRR